MITRAVFTYWTNKGSSYACGFTTEQIFGFIANKSIKSAKKYFETVVCYTDVEGEAKLKELGVDVDTIVVDYSDYEFDERFWNFPKLITYSLQDEPFVHIDLDLILEENPYLEGEIVSEKQRGAGYMSTDYEVIGTELMKEYSPWITCSGLLGGTNTEIFKELFDTSKELVKLENTFDKPFFFSSMVAIEEIVLTILKNRAKIDVQYLNTKFTHYQGPNKNNVTID